MKKSAAVALSCTTKAGWSGRVVVLALAVALTGQAHGLTQTQPAGTCTDEMNMPGMLWGSVSNAQGASDNAAAAVDLSSGGPGSTSTRLRCANYGFTIPANSVINGITLEIRKAADGGMNNDEEVKLLKATVLQTENKAVATFWGSMPFIETYGSASDLWSTTWTPTDINNSGFGAVQSVMRNDGASGAFVDSMIITVDYSLNNGEMCTVGTECDSGFCADSVCCDTACDGPNEACDLPGTVGTCTATAVPGVTNTAPTLSFWGLAAMAMVLLLIGQRGLGRQPRGV